MGGACSTHGYVRNMYNIFVKKPEGKRSRYRWENNIKMDLKETGWEGVDYIHLAQYRDRW
jgi:hypothetical protein